MNIDNSIFIFFKKKALLQTIDSKLKNLPAIAQVAAQQGKKEN